MVRLRNLLLDWGPVLLLMGIIFWASSDSQSGHHTSRFLHPLVKFLFPHVSAVTLDRVSLALRKCAHLAEYAALALLLWRAWVKSHALRGQPRSRRLAWLTLSVILLYAISDEWHQSFVPSRQATAVDVVIDLLGASLALWLAGAFKTPPASVTDPPPPD